MDSNEKLVTAAKRAARRLAKRTGTPYQTCLDDVARSVDRRHWADFLSDPVEVPQEPKSQDDPMEVPTVPGPMDQITALYSAEDALALEATIVFANPTAPHEGVGQTTIRKQSYSHVVRIPPPGEGLPPIVQRPESQRMALGTKGVLLQRTVRAGHDATVVLIGRPGTGKSRNVIGASVMDAEDVNIVIHDPGGNIVPALGRAWTQARQRAIVDFSESRFNGSAVAFDPFHPAMRWGTIAEMAEVVCDILFMRKDGQTEYFGAKARGVVREAIAILDAVPDLIPSDGPARHMTLIGLRDWVAALAENGYARLKGTIAAAMQPGIDLPHEHLSSLGDMADRERSAVLGTVDQAMLPFKNRNVARLIAPDDWNAGGQIGRLLNRVDDRTIIIVRSNPPEAAAFERLRGIVLEWCARLGSAWAGSRRPMHLHLDEARSLPPMPWIRASAAGEAPQGVTTSMAFLDGRSFGETLRTILYANRSFDLVLTSEADVATQSFVERHYGRRELEHAAKRLPSGRMMHVTDEGSQTLRHLPRTNRP
jgi:hypothetical protein